jgi:hypothetical protein
MRPHPYIIDLYGSYTLRSLASPKGAARTLLRVETLMHHQLRLSANKSRGIVVVLMHHRDLLTLCFFRAVPAGSNKAQRSRVASEVKASVAEIQLRIETWPNKPTNKFGKRCKRKYQVLMFRVHPEHIRGSSASSLDVPYIHPQES